MANRTFPYINLSVSFMPTSALPIDARTFFTDMDDMREAAKSAVEVGSNESCDSPYYFGQTLTYKSPDSSHTELYKVVKCYQVGPMYGKGIVEPISSLTQQQVDEVVERVTNDPKIIKIGGDVATLINPKPNSGVSYDSSNGLTVNLSANPGLQLASGGLEIKLDTKVDERGNVILTKSDKGLKGEFCWREFVKDNGS